MSKNKNKQTLKGCMKWLESRRTLFLGLFAGVLACVQIVMVSDDITSAYILLHMKEPENFLISEEQRQMVVMTADDVSSSMQASSSSGDTSLRPAAPDETSSAISSLSDSSDVSSEESTPVSSSLPSQASSSSSSAASSEEASVSSSAVTDFPTFGHATMPVYKVPNWGDMRTPEEWNRTYGELGNGDFVTLPTYNLKDLTSRTMKELQESRNDPDTIKLLTEKLTYSTRYFGAYDLDATEFSGIHPGIDIKLAEDTPVGAIGGGKVHAVREKASGLGLHVIIEHRLPDGSQYFSIYGHLESVAVSEGDVVKPGQIIGRVGMTGKTTAPHLHLQIDKGFGESTHYPYMPDHLPSRTEADRSVVHPIRFIAEHLR